MPAAQGRSHSHWRAVSTVWTRQAGRTTGTLPTGDLDGVEAIAELFGPVLRYFGDTVADGPVAPQVTLEYDYDRDSETLTLTVMSGDTLTAGQVQFRGSGFDAVGASWDEVAGEGVTAESSVTAGDQLQRAAPAVELDLVWMSADGGVSAVIASFSGPDA